MRVILHRPNLSLLFTIIIFFLVKSRYSYILAHIDERISVVRTNLEKNGQINYLFQKTFQTKERNPQYDLEHHHNFVVEISYLRNE